MVGRRIRIFALFVHAWFLCLLTQAHQYSECYRHVYDALQAGGGDALFSEDEFLDSVRRITYGGVTSLSNQLQGLFDKYRNANGVFWVSGVGPNDTPSAATAEFLNSLCQQIYEGILADIGQTVNQAQCRLWIALADRWNEHKERDNRLEQMEEYPNFVNRMTLLEDLYGPSAPFSALPEPLQRVFGDFDADGDGYINTTGAWIFAGQSVDQAQYDMLDNLCVQVKVNIFSAKALEAAGPPTGAPVSLRSAELPTSAPTGAPSETPPFEIPFGKCTVSLATAEVGVQSLSLDQEEYVIFLNKATDFQLFRGLTFDELDPILIDNYNALATNPEDGIPIGGSFPGVSRSAAQNTSLVEICEATSVAIDNVLHPKPTVTPLSSAPTASPSVSISGTVTVLNAVVVSNTAGYGVPELKQGEEFRGLSQGYENFVKGVASTDERRLSSRGRSLRSTTEVEEGSTEVYEVLALEDCPASVSTEGSTCHVVYGRFNASYSGNDAEEDILSLLTNETQGAVNNTDETGLQSHVTAAYPDTQIVVEGVPEDGSVAPPSDAAPEGNGGGGDDGGLSGGVIFAIILVVLILCLCIGFFLYRRRERDESLLNKGHGSSDDGRNETDFEDSQGDPEMGLAPPLSPASSNGLGGLPSGLYGSSLSVRDKEEHNSFTIQEQSLASPVNSRRGQGTLGVQGLTESPSTENSELIPDDWNGQGGQNQNQQSWGGYAGSETSSDNSEDNDRFEDEGDSDDDDDDDGVPLTPKDDVSLVSSALTGNMRQFNNLVESGDWDGVMAAAADFERNDDADSYVVDRKDSIGLGITGTAMPEAESSDSEDSSEDSESKEPNDAGSQRSASRGSASRESASRETASRETASRETASRETASDESYSQGSSQNDTSYAPSVDHSYTSEELRTREEYLVRVEELVKKVVPDEADNVESMMEQFQGREEELINTLQTMYERSHSVRARKSIHKSNPIPDNSNSPGSARLAPGGAGSAAVAAASTIEVGFERSMENFDDGDSGSQFGSQSGSQSGSHAASEESENDYNDDGSDSSGSNEVEQADGGSADDSDRSENSYDDDDDDNDEHETSSFGEENVPNSPIAQHDSHSSSSSGSYEEDDDDENDFDHYGGSDDQEENSYNDDESSDSIYEDDD